MQVIEDLREEAPQVDGVCGSEPVLRPHAGVRQSVLDQLLTAVEGPVHGDGHHIPTQGGELPALHLGHAAFREQDRDPDAGDEAKPAAAPSPKTPPKDEIEDIPEITLDDSINRKVDMAALERKKRLEKEGHVEDEEQTEEKKAEVTEEERARQEKSAAELEKIAEGLARAKTIEDVDDKMAETLFGEELSVAAAAVAARVAEEAATAAATASEPTTEGDSVSAAQPPGTEMEKEFENVCGETPGIEVSIDADLEDQKGGLDLSASQRFATVRALNSGKPGSASHDASGAPAAAAVKPDPIEEQITTSLTQTMKALKVNPDPAAVNDDDDDERKGGFFSRFRRS